MNGSENQMALIGGVLNEFDPQAEKIFESGVTRNDFTGKCKEVWVIIEGLFSEGKVINFVSVNERVKNIDITFLDECYDKCTSSGFVSNFISDVKSETLLRRGKDLLFDCQELLQGATIDNIEHVTAEIQKRWLEMRSDKTEKMDLPELMDEFLDQCENGVAGIVPWFLPSIQNRYGKLTEEYIIIHALPSIGKTALVIQWMTYLHSKGYKSALASLESSARGLAPRFISHLGRLNSLHLKTGSGSPQSLEKARQTVKTAKKLNYKIKDGEMFDGQLMAWCRVQKQNGAQIIFIDNLRHIQSTSHYESETRKFMEMSLAVKRIRDRLGIPIVLLHHSNEDGQVGWSKDIVKDADVILYLEKKNDLGNSVDEVDLIFQKGRDSGTFTIPTRFDKNIQTYEERKY